MAKGAYIGVNNVARKIKKGYIGVGGVARKIKKAYIGVGGVARPCWSGGQVVYYGTTTTPLPKAVAYSAGASNANYAVFAGGATKISVDYAVNDVSAYNSSLTQSIPSSKLIDRGYEVCSATIGDKAVFGGGMDQDEWWNYTACGYDASLTRTTSNKWVQGTGFGTVSSFGNYGIFAGGASYGSGNGYVTVYDSSLSQVQQWYDNNTLGWECAGTAVGNIAILAGGQPANSSKKSSTVILVNESLTKSTASSTLSVARQALKASTIGGYALFAGGSPNSGTTKAVDVFNSSGTRVTTSELTYSAAGSVFSATLQDFAIFGGFDNASGTSEIEFCSVDVFDSSLTRQNITTEHGMYTGIATATIGNYALIAGQRTKSSSSSGGYSNTPMSEVVVFTVV